MINGLAFLHLELTSRCNKKCWMCGRRKRDNLQLTDPSYYGDMPLTLVDKIASEIPSGTVVQFHNNGETLLYPYLSAAVKPFKKKGCITSTTTNGKLILEKYNDVVENFDSIAFSIFENDPEQEEQYQIIEKFLTMKKYKPPYVVFRLIGEVNQIPYKELCDKFNCIIATRDLHRPEGSFGYKLRYPTIPEIGMCIEILTHLAIDRFGNVSVCVRFDPEQNLVLGNIKDKTLDEMWNSEKRKSLIHLHKIGQRNNINFCKECHYWGIPTCFKGEK